MKYKVRKLGLEFVRLARFVFFSSTGAIVQERSKRDCMKWKLDAFDTWTIHREAERARHQRAQHGEDAEVKHAGVYWLN